MGRGITCKFQERSWKYAYNYYVSTIRYWRENLEFHIIAHYGGEHTGNLEKWSLGTDSSGTGCANTC